MLIWNIEVMGINQRNQEKQANLVVDKQLNVGTYEIVCNKCGISIYGPVSGNCTEAARKSMGLKCPNNCNSGFVIHINPDMKSNKYSADKPYPPKDLI